MMPMVKIDRFRRYVEENSLYLWLLTDVVVTILGVQVWKSSIKEEIR